MSRPARCFSISPQRCGLVPEPPEPKKYLPGLAFTRATSSGTVFAGKASLVTKMLGTAQHADRRKILLGIERQLGVERRRDGVAGDAVEADRVAVGRRLGDDVGADIAARPALVLDNEL